MSDDTTTEATEVEDTVSTTPEGDVTTETSDSGDATENDTPEGEQDDLGTSKEAAKYRRRLRDTEVERDALAAQVEALQRATIDAQAEAAKIKPAALWASGAELADLITETGTVDTDKVADAITAARDTLGITVPPNGNHVPREGNNPPAASRDPNAWDSAFSL